MKITRQQLKRLILEELAPSNRILSLITDPLVALANPGLGTDSGPLHSALISGLEKALNEVMALDIRNPNDFGRGVDLAEALLIANGLDGNAWDGSES